MSIRRGTGSLASRWGEEGARYAASLTAPEKKKNHLYYFIFLNIFFPEFWLLVDVVEWRRREAKSHPNFPQRLRSFFFFFDGTPLTPLVLYIYIYIKVFIHDMQRFPPVFLRRDRRDHYKKIFMIIS